MASHKKSDVEMTEELQKMAGKQQLNMCDVKDTKKIEADLKKMLNMDAKQHKEDIHDNPHVKHKVVVTKEDLLNLNAAKTSKDKAKTPNPKTHEKKGKLAGEDLHPDQTEHHHHRQHQQDPEGAVAEVGPQLPKTKKKKKKSKKKKEKEEAEILGGKNESKEDGNSDDSETEQDKPPPAKPGFNLDFHRMKYLDDKLTPAILNELEAEKIFPLKKKSSKFVHAKYFCRLCDYHCDNIPVCRQHANDARHRRRKEIMLQDKLLKRLPLPSERHIEALDCLIDKVYCEHGLTDEEIDYRRTVAKETEELLREKMSNARLCMYGSSLTGFGLKSADLNMDLVLPTGSNPALGLTEAFRLITQSGKFQNVKSDFQSKVPSILFTSPCGALQCQITIGSELACQTSQLLAIYSKLDVRVRKLAVTFKYWGKVCQVDMQDCGSLPSYSFGLMTVFFLQQCQPPVLPVLWKINTLITKHNHEILPDLSEAALKRPKTKEDVETMLAELQQQTWKSENEESVGVLWKDMLMFYGMHFDLGENVICIKSKELLPRSEKKWKSKRVAIEDPFSTKRNVARTMANVRMFDYFYNCLRKAGLYFSLPTTHQNISKYYETKRHTTCNEKEKERQSAGKLDNSSPKTRGQTGSQPGNEEKQSNIQEAESRLVSTNQKVSDMKNTSQILDSGNDSRNDAQDDQELDLEHDVGEQFDDDSVIPNDGIVNGDLTNSTETGSDYSIKENKFFEDCKLGLIRTVSDLESEVDAQKEHEVVESLEELQISDQEVTSKECSFCHHKFGELSSRNVCDDCEHTQSKEMNCVVCKNSYISETPADNAADALTETVGADSEKISDLNVCPNCRSRKHCPVSGRKYGSNGESEGDMHNRTVDKDGKQEIGDLDNVEGEKHINGTDINKALDQIDINIVNHIVETAIAQAIELSTKVNKDITDSEMDRELSEIDENKTSSRLFKESKDVKTPKNSEVAKHQTHVNSVSDRITKSKNGEIDEVNISINSESDKGSETESCSGSDDMENESPDSSPLIARKRKVSSPIGAEYDFKFDSSTLTDGKGPSVFCPVCDKEGHLRMNCPEDKLPEIVHLPPPSKQHLQLLTAVIKQVPKDFRLSEQEINDRDYIRRDLELHIQELFPDAELRLFGSSMNGFGFHQSDLDICVTFPGKNPEDVNFVECIEAICKKLKAHRGLYGVFPITTAKVPIVKFKHRSSQLEGDISMYNVLAMQNTKLLCMYANIDPRVQTLGYAIKILAKVCDIGDASRGSLSSYAYMLMMIHYLQHTIPPLVPVLQELRFPDNPNPEYMVEGWNTWFFDSLKDLPYVWSGCGKNKHSVGELWEGFFRYYLEEFSFTEQVVTIRQLQPLTKFEKLWNGRCIAIEDPFDLGHNLGGGLSRNMNQYIVKTFVNARKLYGTSIKEVPREFRTDQDYFFDKKQLVEGEPPSDRLCRVCSKIGHIAKECPTVKARKERNALEKQRKEDMRKLDEELNKSSPKSSQSSTPRQYNNPQQSTPRQYNANRDRPSTSRSLSDPSSDDGRHSQDQGYPKVYQRQHSHHGSASPHSQHSHHGSPSPRPHHQVQSYRHGSNSPDKRHLRSSPSSYNTDYHGNSYNLSPNSSQRDYQQNFNSNRRHQSNSSRTNMSQGPSSLGYRQPPVYGGNQQQYFHGNQNDNASQRDHAAGHKRNRNGAQLGPNQTRQQQNLIHGDNYAYPQSPSTNQQQPFTRGQSFEGTPQVFVDPSIHSMGFGYPWFYTNSPFNLPAVPVVMSSSMATCTDYFYPSLAGFTASSPPVNLVNSGAGYPPVWFPAPFPVQVNEDQSGQGSSNELNTEQGRLLADLGETTETSERKVNVQRSGTRGKVPDVGITVKNEYYSSKGQ